MSAYVLWGFFALAGMASAAAICFTPGADERLSAAISTPPSGGISTSSVLAKLEAARASEVQAAEPAEVLTGADAELVARLKALEEQLGSLTGSVVSSAAASAPGVTPSSSAETAAKPTEIETTKAADQPRQVRTTAIAPINDPDPAITRTTFGIDLGAEPSFGALRIRWDNLRRKNPELSRLSPRIAVRDNKGKVELRLIAGPFDNAADAAKTCANLLAKGTSCDGGLFDGQRLPAS